MQQDMCYSDAGAVEMVVGENAVLEINTKNGLFRNSSHRASNFTIQDGANVTINHQKATTVTWEENQGVLLQIAPAEVVAGEEYSTIITWTLQDAP